MKSAHIFPLAATLSLAMLGACSKPAPATVDEATATTAAANDAATTTTSVAAGPTDPGGAVSPPQANDAVNPDANTAATDVAPASNSFTEGQAKSKIEANGYTNVSDLKKDDNGVWTGTATKGSQKVNVKLDFQGNVVTQ